MKEGWKVKKFEDCLQKIKRTKKIPKKSFLIEGEYPIISQEKEFVNGYWNDSNDVLKVEKPIVIFGDHTKIIKYIDFDFVKGADGIVTLLPIKDINSKFFAYQLQNIELRDLGYARHYRLLKENEIAFPSLTEQQQIIAILDQAFEAIDQAKANIEKNIENAKELFQSKLNNIFSQKGDGWEEKTLGELGKLTSSKRIYKKEYVAEGVPFYRSKEIKELAHKKDITLELFITKDRYNEIKSQFGIPQEGDILLTAVGTIGEMYVVQKNEPEFYFKDGNIMWLKNFTTLNTYYLKYALMCFVEQLKAMSHGSAYSALTIEKLKKYSISVPSISEQTKIVKQLDDLLNHQREIDNRYKEKINSIEELKKSILQKAFAGELTN